VTQTIHLDSIDELQDLYDGVAEDFRDIDYQPWMSDELNRLADLHRAFFNSSSGPDGALWKPNAPSTIRQKGHSTILRGVRGAKPPRKTRKGGLKYRRSRWIGGYRLATSLSAKGVGSAGDAVREAIDKSTGAQLAFGTTVPYSIYNEDRPHLGMNESHLDGMVERVADHVLAQLAKA